MDILIDLLIIFIICMYFGLKDDNVQKMIRKKLIKKIIPE